MENKSHALAAGSFVLVVLALLLGLAVWLTRDTSSQRMYEISSKEAVTGLQPQAAVRYKGVNVGKVTAIEFDPKTLGHVLIRIAIDDQAPITQSTFATLGYQGVTGLAFVQLDDKGESRLALTTGADALARIPMRAGFLSKLTEQGENILVQLQETSQRFNQLLAPENQKRLMSSVDRLGQAADNISQIATKAGQGLAPLAQETSATLSIMQQTSKRVGDSADEARDSARSFKRLTERMNEQGGTLDQLALGVSALRNTTQSLNASTLPLVNHALEDAAHTARDLSRTVSGLNDNPQSLLFGKGVLPSGPGEPGFTPPKP
jgi:phospholipid/cholesterol/gamma-HCH transport system substrate-binding protein